MCTHIQTAVFENGKLHTKFTAKVYDCANAPIRANGKHIMKICHIITRMIVGGAQENTLFTCQGHLEKGHDVTLITGPSPGPEGELLKRFCPKGLEVIEIPDLIRSISPYKDWKAYRTLRRLFREGHYDVVHTHASKAGILGRAAAWKEKVPLVVHTVHGQAFHKYQNRLINLAYIYAERFAARRCHRIFAVAQSMIEQCVEASVAPREKYKVVYSGMDTDAFVNAKPDMALRSQLGIPENAPVVGKIARLFPLKGHDTLMKAAPKVIASFPDVRFLIIGDGILRQSLEDEARKLGISGNFVFTGLISPEDVCRYTPLMDVLAHLSLREGLPRSVVQALASSVPVVAYALDGTPEVLIDGETGLIARTEDADDVADKIVSLLFNPELRRKMGVAGQALVSKRFSWRTMCDVLEKEYAAGLKQFSSSD